MEQLVDIHDIWYLSIYRKCIEKIQVSLKCDQNDGFFTCRPITFMIISRSILLRLRNVSDISCRGSEMIWKNVVELDRPQMTIWRMRIACWMPKTTNMHSEYIIIIASPLIQWFHECECYAIACLVYCLYHGVFPSVIRITSSSPDDRGATVLWKMTKYRIFSNLICTLFTVSEG